MEHNRILAIINKFTIKSINSADVRIWSLGIISHAGAALLIWLPKKKTEKESVFCPKKDNLFCWDVFQGVWKANPSVYVSVNWGPNIVCASQNH